MGMARPLDGRVHLVSPDASKIGFLPQQTQLDASFPISVLDTVCTGFWRSVGLFGGIKPDLVDRALAALNEVGLAGFENRPAGELSRGQFQRVLFARLMVQDASILLLDEPFTAVDDKTCADLVAIMHRWHAEGRTIIGVLHDYVQIRENFPNTLLLARECLDWGPTERVLCSENLDRARLMAQAWAADAPVCVRVDAA